MTGVLFLLVLAADGGRWLPDAGPLPAAMPPLPFTWELPAKTMHEVPIDGTTYVMGVPVRMRYLMVNDTPGSIGKHFLESFKRQKMYIEPGQAYDRMLTGVDPQSITTYTVVLQPNSPGYTTVILGESRPLERKPREAGGLPVPEKARTALPVQFEDYTLLSFTVGDTVEAVKAFYAVELPRRGYRPMSDGTWVKPGEVLEPTVTTEKGETHVVLKLRRAP